MVKYLILHLNLQNTEREHENSNSNDVNNLNMWRKNILLNMQVKNDSKHILFLNQ